MASGVALSSMLLYWLLCPVVIFESTVLSHVRNSKVVVTGASQGIGKALVLEFARLGAGEVVIVSRSEAKLQAVKTEVQRIFPKTLVHVIAADLSSQEVCDDVVQKAVNLMGGLDTLLLNHITNSRFGTWLVDNKNRKEGQTFVPNMFATNVFSYLWMATASMAALQTSELGGRIGVVSSLAGHIGTPKTAVYSSTKHSLHGFFNALRVELKLMEQQSSGSFNNNVSITLCAIGATDTEGAREVMAKMSSSLTWDSPVRAAKSIIDGVVSKSREIYHPHHIVFPAVLINALFPGLLDNVLVQNMMM
jgi:short-subunit dehydrogenase